MILITKILLLESNDIQSSEIWMKNHIMIIWGNRIHYQGNILAVYMMLIENTISIESYASIQQQQFNSCTRIRNIYICSLTLPIGELTTWNNYFSSNYTALKRKFTKILIYFSIEWYAKSLTLVLESHINIGSIIHPIVELTTRNNWFFDNFKWKVTKNGDVNLDICSSSNVEGISNYSSRKSIGEIAVRMVDFMTLNKEKN